jgi:hypothetical protein
VIIDASTCRRSGMKVVLKSNGCAFLIRLALLLSALPGLKPIGSRLKSDHEIINKSR